MEKRRYGIPFALTASHYRFIGQAGEVDMHFDVRDDSFLLVFPEDHGVMVGQRAVGKNHTYVNLKGLEMSHYYESSGWEGAGYQQLFQSLSPLALCEIYQKGAAYQKSLGERS